MVVATVLAVVVAMEGNRGALGLGATLLLLVLAMLAALAAILHLLIRLSE